MLPAGLFSEIPGDSVGIFFSLYTEAALFPLRKMDNPQNNGNSTLRTEVGSAIVGANVGSGLTFTGIDPPVVIQLRLNFDGTVSTV